MKIIMSSDGPLGAVDDDGETKICTVHCFAINLVCIYYFVFFFRFVILKYVRRDLISNLPLPRRLVDYLSATHYYSELLADIQSDFTEQVRQRVYNVIYIDVMNNLTHRDAILCNSQYIFIPTNLTLFKIGLKHFIIVLSILR